MLTNAEFLSSLLSGNDSDVIHITKARVKEMIARDKAMQEKIIQLEETLDRIRIDWAMYRVSASKKQ